MAESRHDQYRPGHIPTTRAVGYQPIVDLSSFRETCPEVVTSPDAVSTSRASNTVENEQFCLVCGRLLYPYRIGLLSGEQVTTSIRLPDDLFAQSGLLSTAAIGGERLDPVRRRACRAGRGEETKAEGMVLNTAAPEYRHSADGLSYCNSLRTPGWRVLSSWSGCVDWCGFRVMEVLIVGRSSAWWGHEPPAR